MRAGCASYTCCILLFGWLVLLLLLMPDINYCLVPADVRITVRVTSAMPLPPVPPETVSPNYFTSVTLKLATGLELRIFKPDAAFEQGDDGVMAKHPMVSISKGDVTVNFPWVSLSGAVQWGWTLATPTLTAFNEGVMQAMMSNEQREQNIRKFIIRTCPDVEVEAKVIELEMGPMSDVESLVREMINSAVAANSQATVDLEITYHSTTDERNVSVKVWNRSDESGKIELTGAEFNDLQFVMQHRRELAEIACPGYAVPDVTVTTIGL